MVAPVEIVHQELNSVRVNNNRHPRLTTHDLGNLLSVLEQRTVQWTSDSQQRCRSRGYITPRLSLTDSGLDVATRTQNVLSRLRRGVPVECMRPTPNLDHKILSIEKWFHLGKKFRDGRSGFCSSCVEHGFLSLFDIDRHTDPGVQQRMVTFLERKLSVKQFLLSPVAYQLDRIPGYPVVVFKDEDTKQFVRIRALWYEWFATAKPTLIKTWMHSRAVGSPVTVWAKGINGHGQPIGHIMPVVGDWPVLAADVIEYGDSLSLVVGKRDKNTEREEQELDFVGPGLETFGV